MTPKSNPLTTMEETHGNGNTSVRIQPDVCAGYECDGSCVLWYQRSEERRYFSTRPLEDVE